MAVGEALRRLCEEIGWSYAVFWKAIGAADPVHLVWEDGYCGHNPCPAGSEASEALVTEFGCIASADTMCSLVRKVMAAQVHVVRQGTIGRAAFTGNHQWIVLGTTNDHGLSPEVAAEMNNQFRAGIKTIAIIPVLPRGVLQLGSTGVVMENTKFVMHAKKLCSQMNNRSSMSVSASVKNTSCQSRSLHGASNPRTSSKIFNQFPVSCEQYSQADSAIVSSSKSLNASVNASLFEVAQQNGQTDRAHIVYSKPNSRFVQQVSYCDSQPGCNTPVPMSSGLISSSLQSAKQQQLLMRNIGQFGNGARPSPDSARNAILTSLVYRNSLMHEHVDINLLHGGVDVSTNTTSHGNYDFLLGDARVVSSNLCTSASSQVSDQGSRSTSGMLLQNQPPVSFEVPQSSEFNRKMAIPKQSFEALPAISSESDIQVSNVLNSGISQENLLRRSGHIPQNQNDSRVNHPIIAVGTQGTKNAVGCMLPGMLSETTDSLHSQPTRDNGLFDILGPEFHQLCRDVDADFAPWCDSKPQSSDRGPESSICPDSSLLFSSLDNEFPCSGILSLTDANQLLDAVISNVNPGVKQSPDDGASCKTSLTNIPRTSICPKELKQCDSPGIPSVLIKHEFAQIVKQPCYINKDEDGCLSQNNGMQKSQLRLWIENGHNMKCENVSASNSKGLDIQNKENRKRSRPGESTKPRPKDRQLIQDRIKELREMVPNGAKYSIDALLEKTVKHMLFLQSMTKHTDKLKDSIESKILSSHNGPVSKDSFESGATWAFDVGSQSMTCPIIVEDLDRPRQMLVEMLCKDRGIFLEIADFIKGLGLTILRGIMEARKSKIWARFTVEANRDVTRMEIFLSLVRLLEPNCDGNGTSENSDVKNMPLGLLHQPVVPPTGHIQ